MISRIGPCINAATKAPSALPTGIQHHQPSVPPPKPRTENSSQINSLTAHLRCMIDGNSGILYVSDVKPNALCYFELDDLNIQKGADLVEVVMLMNRMNGIRVQLQARLIDDSADIQYVSHLKGVQIVGQIPSYMKNVVLTRADVSNVQAGLQGEKVKLHFTENFFQKKSSIYI